MKNFLFKIYKNIIDYILDFQEKKYGKKLENSYSASFNGIKTTSTPYARLEIKNKLIDEMRTMLKAHVTPIIKENIKNPKKLLEYIEKNGTKVYRIKNAKNILKIIKEEEGFITPMKGYRAIYANMLLNKRFYYKTDEFFLLDEKTDDIYFLANQFYRWYGWKIQMPGYDNLTQEKFKRILEIDDKSIEKLNYEELISLKEAIRRDIEAINFVIDLAKENDGTKNSYKDLKEKGTNI